MIGDLFVCLHVASKPVQQKDKIMMASLPVREDPPLVLALLAVRSSRHAIQEKIILHQQVDDAARWLWLRFVVDRGGGGWRRGGLLLQPPG